MISISITRQWRWAFIIFAAGIIALLGVLIAGRANAAPGGNGPSLGTGNAYYTGPVHLCTKLGSESVGYVEQNSFVPANCQEGDAQFTANTPYIDGTFTLNLGDTTYNCGTETSGLVINAINCTLPAS